MIEMIQKDCPHMYIYIDIFSIYISISISLYIYLFVVCMYINISISIFVVYIYIYVCTPLEEHGRFWGDFCHKSHGMLDSISRDQNHHRLMNKMFLQISMLQKE